MQGALSINNVTTEGDRGGVLLMVKNGDGGGGVGRIVTMHGSNCIDDENIFDSKIYRENEERQKKSCAFNKVRH